MIEHNYWTGSNYKKGIADQRLMIVGYSHYRAAHEVDHANFTIDTIDLVLSENSIPFFRSIAGYFGRDADFWDEVIFFNFIPNVIGTSEQKFLWGTKDQVGRGRERALKIMNTERPDKLIAFTTKGWRSFPPTDEEKPTAALGNTIPLGASFPREYRWGTYRFDEHKVTAVGLKHPQGAHADTMGRAVREALRLP
jgi:hypothetical protein